MTRRLLLASLTAALRFASSASVPMVRVVVRLPNGRTQETWVAESAFHDAIRGLFGYLPWEQKRDKSACKG